MDNYIPRDAFAGDRMNPGLALFVQNQQVQKKLTLEQQLKDAELTAMMERAKMADEGATQRNEATNAAHIAVNAATNAAHVGVAQDRLDAEKTFHQKDFMTGEQIDGINESYPGINLPRIDGMPVSVVTRLIGDYQAGKTQQAITDRTLTRQGEMDQRRLTSQEAMEARRLANENVQREKARLLATTKEQAGQHQDAQKNLNALVLGALNANPLASGPKAGQNTAFDPGQALIDNPTEALRISEEAGAAGGWPKGVPVTPIRSYSSYNPSHWYSLENANERARKEREFNANAAQFQQNLKAPPSTGGGLNKGKSTGGMVLPPPAAGTQPLNQGDLGGMVGAQPSLPAPGPSALPGSPSSLSLSPSPQGGGGYIKGTYKGRPAMVNPATGHIKYLDAPGVM